MLKEKFVWCRFLKSGQVVLGEVQTRGKAVKQIYAFFRVPIYPGSSPHAVGLEHAGSGGFLSSGFHDFPGVPPFQHELQGEPNMCTLNLTSLSTLSPLFIPTGFTRGDSRFTLRLSVCPSVNPNCRFSDFFPNPLTYLTEPWPITLL